MTPDNTIHQADASAQRNDEATEVPPPPLPIERLRRNWQRYEARTDTIFEQNFLVTHLTARMHVEQYENVTLRERILEETLRRFPEDDETVLMALFAARIAYEPGILGVPVLRGTIMNRTRSAAREHFESNLREKGVTDIQQVDSGRIELHGGAVADLYQYRGAFPVPPTEVHVIDDVTVTIDPGEMGVDGWLAVWTDDGETLIAGGAYPAEDFEETTEVQLTDSIGLTVRIDIGFNPDEYKAELFELIRSIGEPGADAGAPDATGEPLADGQQSGPR